MSEVQRPRLPFLARPGQASLAQSHQHTVALSSVTWAVTGSDDVTHRSAHRSVRARKTLADVSRVLPKAACNTARIAGRWVLAVGAITLLQQNMGIFGHVLPDSPAAELCF